MNKIVLAVAAALPCLLVACQKKEAEAPTQNSDVKVPNDAPVAWTKPEHPTDKEKQDIRDAMDAEITQAKFTAAALADNWKDTFTPELRINYIRCRLPNGNPAPDDECHLPVKPYDSTVPGSPLPVRYLNISEHADNPGHYSAHIRSKANGLEFLLCPSLEQYDTAGRIEGYCVFNPHVSGSPLHWVTLRLLKSTTVDAYRSVKIRYYDAYPGPSGQDEVHNGEGHGGDQ